MAERETMNINNSETRSIELAFDKINASTPCLEPVITSYRGLFVSKALIKHALAEKTGLQINAPDPQKLLEGRPWLTEQGIASLVDPWCDNVKEVSTSIAKAFPETENSVSALVKAIEKKQVIWDECVISFIEGDEERIMRLAQAINVEPALLKFILFNLIKPFVEKRVEGLGDSLQGLSWFEGYCPVCGAFPELSYLKEKEGQRWLRCSFCSHDWRFDRMICPFCKEKNEHKELLYVDGDEKKWVELCSSCNRYIANVDLRENEELRTDIAAIGMIHLDAIAQQKGYIPTANCTWNVLITP